MKLFLPLIYLCFFWAGAFAQAPFTVQNLNMKIINADISAVDIDNDGDRDLLVSGETEGENRPSILQLFENDGDGNYTPIASPFEAAFLPNFDWGDINGDGLLDMVESGYGSTGTVASLYQSNEAGDFVLNESVPFHNLTAHGIGFAELNNDGYTDIYVFGNHFHNVKAKIYFNDKTGGFTESSQFENYLWTDPVVTEVDFDNDGDLDLFVSGTSEGPPVDRFSKIFVNVNGIFTVKELDLLEKGFGSAVWGDYDSDGDLDLLLSGDGWFESGENNDNIMRLYNNDEGNFTEAATFSPYRQFSVGDGTRFADWDNDGDLDIIVTGTGNGDDTDIYINDEGSFTPYEFNDNLPGVNAGSIEVADTDNDGDLDLMVSGYSWNDFNGAGGFASMIAAVVENPTTNVNEVPALPTNLTATAEEDGSSVTFSWDAPTDDTTPSQSLSYNLFLIDANGKHIVFPLADTTSGYMIVQELGNVQLNTSWTIHDLPEGVYRWGVQAIDNSFAGSEFAKQNATVSYAPVEEEEIILGINDVDNTLGMVVAPNPSQGNITVSFDQNNATHNVTVFTMGGKKIKGLSAQGDIKLQLNPGLYLLHATDPKGERVVRKLIVE